MNQLKVNQQQTIVALYQQGWSKRRIARELGVDRVTVRRYLVAAEPKSPINPQTGSAWSSNSPTNPQTGSLHLGGTGSDSLCEPWKECIEAGLAAGLSVQRIHQDLIAEQRFEGSYHSVRRYVLRLGKTVELSFRRIEVEPGEEMQVDFGQGAWVLEQGHASSSAFISGRAEPFAQRPKETLAQRRARAAALPQTLEDRVNLAWLGNFRRLLVRYDHQVQMYEAFFHVACLIITL